NGDGNKAAGGGVGNRRQPSQRDRPRSGAPGNRQRRPRPSPNEWAEKRSPAQSNQRAERRAHCTRNESGISAGHGHRIGAAPSSWPSGPANAGREANQTLQQTAAALLVSGTSSSLGRRPLLSGVVRRWKVIRQTSCDDWSRLVA